jgi:hypothetical protein
MVQYRHELHFTHYLWGCFQFIVGISSKQTGLLNKLLRYQCQNILHGLKLLRQIAGRFKSCAASTVLFPGIHQ